ncbi:MULTISPECIES: YbaB/EbfC family nucleoid-associated protein [Catenuloplanes]|uniref:DNA-binding protein YbaB n=1 Tax=Catenuloplanes niger TaxID=587534 RepID=A0AAE4CYW0_9ACTN|nr:YbaB/EbfC family nucleoid-associated protein [Catenuloplanes niger]MDR7328003.1 DNA-binding protein YbaB [Catenuloplanes niger]
MDTAAMVERARRVRETVATAAVEVTSADHEVTVVAGPNGVVRDLRLTPRAFRLTGAELGELVVRTITAANARMAVELRETLTDLLGERGPGVPDPLAPLPSPAAMRAEMDGTA